MDMRKHLGKRWLNGRTIAAMPGERFVGIIAEVREEVVRNRYNATKSAEPVVYFRDEDFKLLPNIGQRLALIEMFGPDTADWTGRQIVVACAHRTRINRATGEETSRPEKIVLRGDDQPFRVPPTVPAAADEPEDWGRA